ncbi:MAG: replicative DNA helicase [Gammaproteobacteria bacterium]|nr:replicative DNA helicase [Gammaproteobacteria bacterium]
MAKNELPYDIEAEEAYLGAVIIDPDVLITTELEPGDMYLRKHSLILEAAQSLHKDGAVVDIVTLCDRLGDNLVAVGGRHWVVDLINVTPTAIHAEHYAGIISEKARYRKAIDIAQRIVRDAFDQQKPAGEILAEASAALINVDGKVDQRMRSSSQIIDAMYDHLDRIRENPNAISGLPTGITDIDKMTGGLQKGDLIVIAGRPGMGKTSLAAQIAENAGAKYGAKAVIISLEMSGEQLMQRIISPKIGVTASDIRCGKLTDEQWQEFVRITPSIRENGLYIEDSGYIKPSQIRAKCLKHQAQHGLDLLVIDYIQIMSSDGKHNGNKHQEVSEISRSCKQLARELRVPVLLLSQLSRSCESRANKRPMLSDLRESGAIEADADMVWFIYRDEIYNTDTDSPNVAEIIIAKHRTGATGTVMTFFQKQFTRFFGLETKKTHLDWDAL